MITGLIKIKCVCVLQGVCDAPDLEFEYFDSDKWTAELSGTTAPHLHTQNTLYPAVASLGLIKNKRICVVSVEY